MTDAQIRALKFAASYLVACGYESESAHISDILAAHAENRGEKLKEQLIDNSGGFWVDDEFRINCRDLSAMLDAAIKAKGA